MASMRRLIRELSGEGRTLSSHLLAEVQQCCHRVGVIVDGRMSFEGTVEELRGARLLQVRAEPGERAAPIVKGAVGSEVEHGVGGDGRAVLTADAAGVDVPALVRDLVAGGVDVHSVAVRERSLEEVFLTMTEAKR